MISLMKNDDGHWLTFHSSSGKSALISIEDWVLDDLPKIAGQAVLEWAKENAPLVCRKPTQAEERQLVARLEKAEATKLNLQESEMTRRSLPVKLLIEYCDETIALCKLLLNKPQT